MPWYTHKVIAKPESVNALAHAIQVVVLRQLRDELNLSKLSESAYAETAAMPAVSRTNWFSYTSTLPVVSNSTSPVDFLITVNANVGSFVQLNCKSISCASGWSTPCSGRLTSSSGKMYWLMLLLSR